MSPKNKTQRVECAKKLRSKFGYKCDRTWKWNKVINSDFSGTFTNDAFQNKQNDVVYAKNAQQIPADLRTAPKDKFPKGVMFWGAISSLGLIPKKGPINATKWLNDQKPQGQRKKMYLTGNLYAQFLKEKAIPEVKKVFGISFSDAIWQDDQDKKQRMQIVLDVIKENFSERIETEDGDAKFAVVGLLKMCGEC